MENKAQLSGYVTLFIGVALLAFTFISAYLFLRSNPSIPGSPDLVAVFGESLAPLIVTCIRVMYLGVMGWIGSVLTIRGVQLVTQFARHEKPEVNIAATTPLKTPTPKTRVQRSEKLRKVKAAK